MRAAIVILLGLLLLVVVLRFVRTGAHSGASTKVPPKDVYQGLRSQALQSSRAELGLPATPTPTTPWGVVMDWGVARGIATVVAFSDGHASIYLSNGGGFLGGAESHNSIRDAAKRMVEVAAQCQTQAHPTTSYPLPVRGAVIFYFLTDSGVFTASASQDDLAKKRSSLAGLGNAAQEVIAQYSRTR